MAKVRVELPSNIENKDRKELKRLCRRLGEVKSSSSSLILKIRRLPAGKVIRFLESQPKIVSAHKI